MYRGEIGSPHAAHLPRSAHQLTIGMFWYHFMHALHFGQCEGGDTTLSSRGRRQIHTFRKLATQLPNANANAANR